MKVGSSVSEELEQLTAKLQDEKSSLLSEKEKLDTLLTKERQNAQEKLALLEESKVQLKQEFQNLAQGILEDKSRKFTEQNKEGLNPAAESAEDPARRLSA